MNELDIKVGFECNNNCIFCLNKDKRETKTFDVEVLKLKINSYCEKNRLEKLIISGGEPLIYKNLFEILDFAKNKGAQRFEIQTNGRMLAYIDMIRRLENYKPINFLLSLHFSQKNLYKKYMQIDGFDQVIRGIRNLTATNLGFTVNTVIMKQNLNDLENIINLLLENKVKRTQYRYIDGKNVINEYTDFVPKYSDAIPVTKKIIKHYSNDINIFLREIPLCLLGEQYKKFLSIHSEKRLNATTNDLLTNQEVEKNQFKHPNCTGCFYINQCPGIRNEYIQMYGSPEIIPIVQ